MLALQPTRSVVILQGEIIRKCLARTENQVQHRGLCASDNALQCSFLEYRNYKCIYRRYASLFFIVGVDHQQVRSLAPALLMCMLYCRTSCLFLSSSTLWSRLWTSTSRTSYVINSLACAHSCFLSLQCELDVRSNAELLLVANSILRC